MRPRAYGNTGLWPSPSHGWMDTDARMSAQSRAHVIVRASALHTGPAVSALPTENGGNQDSEPVEVSLCRPHAEALHELAPELRAALPAQARATQPHIAVGAADPKLERVVRWVEDSTHAVGAPRRGSAQVSTANGYGGCCTGTSGRGYRYCGAPRAPALRALRALVRSASAEANRAQACLWSSARRVALPAGGVLFI